MLVVLYPLVPAVISFHRYLGSQGVFHGLPPRSLLVKASVVSASSGLCMQICLESHETL